jgi:hypothetical protein
MQSWLNGLPGSADAGAATPIAAAMTEAAINIFPIIGANIVAL